MKQFRLTLILVVSGLFVWSCGDSPTNPLALTEFGSVSLLVDADINGSEDIGSGTFSTSYVVTIRDSLAQPVNDAAVGLVHVTLGTVVLPWDSITPGRYAASSAGYVQGTYLLQVRRGTDSLINGQVPAPDIHQITYPTVADTLAQDQPFTVTWTRAAQAEIIEVETRDFGPSLTTGTGADSGSYLIPASFNNRDDQRIRVWRSNTSPLVWGLAGSTFEARIRNAVEPVVVQ